MLKLTATQLRLVWGGAAERPVTRPVAGRREPAPQDWPAPPGAQQSNGSPREMWRFMLSEI